ncbi:MAG TPA: DNA recombination protein RmuC [Thiobacillaceae bacterium]|nr:DNA recombination protein RmuC [Thiobacillaceae bacterium]
MSLIDTLLLGGLGLVLLAMIWLALRFAALQRQQQGLPDLLSSGLETRHRDMLKDLHEGLSREGNRTQSGLQALQQEQAGSQTRFLDATLKTFAEQGKRQQELMQNTMKNAALQLTATIEALAKTVDGRLGEISGKVAERLDAGFKNTNETFAKVMERLATIDEAQKKLDGLTSNVVSLQEILGDKRSRGAFGEVQLEALVRNILPPTAYAFQQTLSNGSRVDCLLTLPEPTGKVAVDSKFPLENFSRMFDRELAEAERSQSVRAFKADVKKHVDDIASKYIIEHETSDGAVMFVPAEAVFAEIHAYHADLVDYALSRRVWIVSPTTMMAVLNTARAVIKDVETRRQVHIIKDALSKLGKDFNLFDDRLQKLASHIRQAHEDTERIQISGNKLFQHFKRIESVDLEHLRSAQPLLPDNE